MTVEHDILQAVYDNGGQIDRNDLSNATDLIFELLDPQVENLVRKKHLRYLRTKKGKRKIMSGGWMMVEITPSGKSELGV